MLFYGSVICTLTVTEQRRLETLNSDTSGVCIEEFVGWPCHQHRGASEDKRKPKSPGHVEEGQICMDWTHHEAWRFRPHFNGEEIYRIIPGLTEEHKTVDGGTSLQNVRRTEATSPGLQRNKN